MVSKIITYVLTLWISKVFLFSLPYKFSGHPDTQHIFSTIGQWLSGFLGVPIGEFFEKYGAYGVGSFEMITSIVLLLGMVVSILKVFGMFESSTSKMTNAAFLSTTGGLMATLVMTGAVFFHVFSPLGIEVINHGQSDSGSLFYAAVSIMVSGLFIAFLNKNHINDSK